MESTLFAFGCVYGLGFVLLFAEGVANYSSNDITPEQRKKAARTILTSFAWPVVYVICFIIWLIRTAVRIVKDAI